MTRKELGQDSKSLLFSAQAAELIFSEKKMATTKLLELNPIQCIPGDVVWAECGDETQFEVVIIDVSDQKLSQLSIPRMALGSFVSHQEAVDKLSSFFQIDIDQSTMVRHFVFIPKDKFDGLPEETQTILVEKSIEELFLIQELSNMFLPTILHWFTEKNALDGEDFQSLDEITKRLNVDS